MIAIDSTNKGSVALLTEAEIDQVGGAVGPLVAYALWTAGGAVVGFAGAAIVHYFDNGNHSHAK